MTKLTSSPALTSVLAASAIAAVILTMSTAAAQGSNACQRRVDTIRDQTLRFAEGIEDRHNRELTSILSAYDRRDDINPGRRTVTDASVAGVIERNSVEEIRTRLIEQPIEEYRYTFRNASNPNACPPVRWIRGFFRAYLNHFELELGVIRDEVSNRHALDRLQADEGLLILAYNSDWGANRVSINRLGSMSGGIEFTAPLDGQFFRIMPVKAGEYRWEEVSRDVLGGRRVLYVDRMDIRFTVHAGQINYIGAFLVDRGPRYTTASLHQRTSMVLTQAFELYPDLLARFRIVNAADPDDPFLPYFLAERQRAAAQANGHDGAQ